MNHAMHQTTLAQNLYRKLGGDTNVAHLIHDYYYKDLSRLTIDERAKVNFDHPESLETTLLIQHIKDLKNNESVHVPTYDFSTHSRIHNNNKIVDPRKIILVEGILIFAETELVNLFDVKVFVDEDPDIRLMRRITRDVSERGRSVESVMEQYKSSVRPMHQIFVEPSKQFADIVVLNSGGKLTKELPSHQQKNWQ